MLTMVAYFLEDVGGSFIAGTRHDFDTIEHFAKHAPLEDQQELERELTKLPYKKFLRTFYWRAIKARVIANQNGACNHCRHRGIPLDVHHEGYAAHGREHLHLEQLRALCRECHNAWHRRAKRDPLRELISNVAARKGFPG